MNNPKFEIFLGNDRQYHFHLKAGNGEIILQSEAYTTKSNCQNGINSVEIHAPFDSNYKKLMSSSNEYYFNLVADNNQIIGTSQMYSSSYAREVGINSVKKNAPIADVIEL